MLRRLVLLLGLAAALVAVGVATAAQRQRARVCKPHDCRASVVVDGTAEWASPWRYRARRVQGVDLWVAGHRINPAETFSCRGYGYGHGVAVRMLSTCRSRDRQPLVFRFASVRTRPVRVYIRIRDTAR